MPSQARIERDALGYCKHSRDHHRHVWMKFASVPRFENAPAVFCSRCGVRGVFSQLELEQWQKHLDRYWQGRGVNLMRQTERLRDGADSEQETCDRCDLLWEVKFEWDYTDAERYCIEHLMTPSENQPGKTLLDFMPDCQKITHRILANDPASKRRFDSHGRPATTAHPVRVRSTAMLQTLLTGVFSQLELEQWQRWLDRYWRGRDARPGVDA